MFPNDLKEVTRIVGLKTTKNCFIDTTINSVQFILMAENDKVCASLEPIQDFDELPIAGKDCTSAMLAIDYFPSGFFGSKYPTSKNIKWRVKSFEVVFFTVAAVIILASIAIITFMCI
jgi:hypothetical protein